MRCFALLLVLAASLVAAHPPPPPKPLAPPRAHYEGPRPPWRARRRRIPTSGRIVKMRAPGQALIDLRRWPQEPMSPNPVDPSKLARALRTLCGWMPPKRPHRYARWILDAHESFGVDPFLLAALIYRQSLCNPQKRDDYGVGLTGINVPMHRGFFRHRRYRYWLPEKGQWRSHEKAIPRYLFYGPNVRRSQPNIYFAAALLAIDAEQHRHGVCKAFGSVPHRHFVSHFIWGDRVRDAGAEDRILRARRRLLVYYAGTEATQATRGRWHDIGLRFPLDAPPRKITSGLGDARSKGTRRHKGLDFSSTFGEPVRAVADGKVIIAGIDARVGPARNMPCDQAKGLAATALGPGGFFVMVRHQGGLVSAYMHLSSYEVHAGQQVKQGERLGRVGRTGMKVSSAHLHFELRVAGKHIDPTPYLGPDVFPPEATYLGRKLRWERYRRRRHEAYQRWKTRHARTKKPRQAR